MHDILLRKTVQKPSECGYGCECKCMFATFDVHMIARGNDSKTTERKKRFNQNAPNTMVMANCIRENRMKVIG